MNSFQGTYENRLQEWFALRQELKNLDIQQQCIRIDAFWQQCPLVNHYLHPTDIHIWPGPWDLIYENNYCQYARALGMVYTLLMLGIQDIDFVDAKDDNREDVVLVLVDNAKYILNYYPNSVLSNTLKDFKINAKFDLGQIVKHIK